MADPYDSTASTKAHINRVQELIQLSCGNLANRAAIHDASKLESEEKDAFDRGTPALKDLEYGSDEYKAAFKKYGMTDSINHHYAHNPHHPEFYAIGPTGAPEKHLISSGVAIGQMSIFDILEMLCDWKAASERHTTGNIGESLKINIERFGIDSQLATILYATIVEMGFVEAGSLDLPRHPEIQCRSKSDSIAVSGFRTSEQIQTFARDLRHETERAIDFFDKRYAEIPVNATIEAAVTIDWRKP